MSNPDQFSPGPGNASTDPIIDRSPIFYGWVILAVGTLGYIMTSPGQTYVISVVLEPLMGDLGISRSLVSVLYGVATIISGFALPYIGRNIDRYGPRPMVIGITALSVCPVCLWLAYRILVTASAASG